MSASRPISAFVLIAVACAVVRTLTAPLASSPAVLCPVDGADSVTVVLPAPAGSPAPLAGAVSALHSTYRVRCVPSAAHHWPGHWRRMSHLAAMLLCECGGLAFAHTTASRPITAFGHPMQWPCAVVRSSLLLLVFEPALVLYDATADSVHLVIEVLRCARLQIGSTCSTSEFAAFHTTCTEHLAFSMRPLVCIGWWVALWPRARIVALSLALARGLQYAPRMLHSGVLFGSSLYLVLSDSGCLARSLP